MAEFTPDQEKASKFYHNWTRFQTFMKEYEEAYKNTQIATRSIKKIEENESGLSMTEVVEHKEKWKKLLESQQKIVDERLGYATTNFQNIRDLLTSST